MRLVYKSLARLPKSRRWTSVNDKEQTPGLVAPFFPHYVPPAYSEAERIRGIGCVIDPSHPATKTDKRKLPCFRGPAVGANIYPMALLLHYSSPFPQIPFLTWNERIQSAREDGFGAVRKGSRAVLVRKVGVEGEGEGKPKYEKGFEPYDGTEQVYPKQDHNTTQLSARRAAPRGVYLDFALRKAGQRVPMSHSNATSKKRVGSFAYMRSRVAKRLRAVLHLIITRGAYVVDQPQENERQDTTTMRASGEKDSDKYPQIRFNDDDTGKKWSLQGWTYIFYPTSDIYRMSLAELIPQVRETLEKVNSAALKLENNWLANSLLQDAPPHRQKPDASASSLSISGGSPAASNIGNPSVPVGREGNSPDKRRIKKQNSHSTTLSSAATGNKPHDVWERELTVGLALLRRRIPKDLF